MNKDIVYKYMSVCVCVYNGILTIKKNESESVVVRWMNIETVMQSEVSQKEKSKHINSVLLHILGFPDSPAGKESTCNAGDLCSILGWQDSLEKGKATHSSILA